MSLPSSAMSSAPSAIHILVIDDEPDLRTLYELTLLREGYTMDTASCLAEVWVLLNEKRYDVIITDMRLPDGLGLEVLQYLQSAERSERCIMITAYGSADNAVESLKAGAFDYLTKPVDLKQFRATVASAVQGGPAAKRNRPALANLSRTPQGMADTGVPAALTRMVGESYPMQQVKARIARVARSMAPVLVRGESGTGKELAAAAIHGCSHRSNGPFVAVNCGAIPENLLEAEFFGAKKGSYTGATQDREGYFQAARYGTLFLDEIGDLPLAMQSKLLRAIQERRVRTLGATAEDQVDVRIVSATHKDLAQEVLAGRFRQDLFYRLNVIEISLPPLRQRRADLPALCQTLLHKIAKESGLSPPPLTPHLLEQLNHHPLHGNVRELENLLHRALALNDGSSLDLDLVTTSQSAPTASQTIAPTLAIASHEPQAAEVNASLALSDTVPSAKSVSATQPPPGTPTDVTIPDDLQAHLDAQERAILIKVLQETHFNRTAAAARLKLSLRQMRYRIERLNIALPGDTDAGHDN